MWGTKKEEYMELSSLLQPVIEIARASGHVIFDIYQHGEFEEKIKSDNTPVTSADLAAHRLITERLSLLTPNIPVLSEEDAGIPFNRREYWTQYWLVDPLDGTQEFIAGSGDFATMIALVENHQPVMGVVYCPMTDVCYYARKGHGAWKVMPNGEERPLSVMKNKNNGKSLSIAISRRQNVKTITDCFTPDRQYNFVPRGSAALKSCLVAEGVVDCYLRIGPTGEWDTAATQCIVEESGGQVLDLTLKPLSYNERDSLENPNFIVLGDTSLPWREIVLFDNG